MTSKPPPGRICGSDAMVILFPYMARWNSAHASRYYHLLNSVAALGHSVIVVEPPSRRSGEANDLDMPLPNHPGISIVTVPINRWFWNAGFPLEKIVKKLFFTLRSVPTVRRAIREHKVDLIYLYNIPQAVYLPGARPGVVFDFADDLIGMLEAELSITGRHPVSILARRVLRWITDRSDFVMCISGPLMDRVQHPRKFLIPNGAGRPPDRKSIPGSALRPVRTVGYVGAFEYSMALDQILGAAERLPELEFLVIGAGRDFGRITREVNTRNLRNVRLTGGLPHTEAMNLVDTMDICLNLFHRTPVSHAVSPLKLFEYLVRGKPVISTRLAEVQRIDQGFLYYGDTVDEIVQVIRHISAHPEEAALKALKGRSVVLERFTWERIAGDFIAAAEASVPGLHPGKRGT